MTVLTEPAAIEVREIKPDYSSLETADNIISCDHIKKICFVCTGNTCRSPMAMAVYNELFKDKKSYAVSLGLYPNIGAPISENARQALCDEGIMSSPQNRYDRHRADIVTEERLNDCDAIVGLTEAHTLELIGRFPRLASRILSMPRSISDPYGGDITVYKRCLHEILEGIKELFCVED